MLTLDQARKAYAEQDESQLYVKTGSKMLAGVYTFQLVSPETALGYKVFIDEFEHPLRLFFPMHLDRAGYDGKAQARSWRAASSKGKEEYASLNLAVWDFKADGVRILELSGANIRAFFAAMEQAKDPMKVKFQLIKNDGPPVKYNITLKVTDSGKPEVADKKVVEKPLHMCNLFFGLSPINDPCRDINEFVDNYYVAG